MDYLDDYIISTLVEPEIYSYTKEQLLAYESKESYNNCLESNLNKYFSGYIFLGAKLNKDYSIIGGISLDKENIRKRSIYIEDFFVNSNYRNMGVATNILDYIIENKKVLFQKRRIILSLLCEDYLQSFYEKQKFSVDNLFVTNNQKVLRMIRKI